MKPKLLLHVCCAPCSTYVLHKVRGDYDVTLYFYNPNIHPKEEYLKRLGELVGWAKTEGIPLIEEKYEPEVWFDATRGLENEPEKGARCEVCFDLRLDRAAQKAVELDFQIFGAVLSVSPHKDSAVISRVGESKSRIYGVDYLDGNWKKENGYLISTKKARDLGFYRQNYCGCVYSLRVKVEKTITKKDTIKDVVVKTMP